MWKATAGKCLTALKCLVRGKSSDGISWQSINKIMEQDQLLSVERPSFLQTGKL